jgi:osmotically-inducible protein OsmY|nr:putative transporter [uncultured bacterium]
MQITLVVPRFRRRPPVRPVMIVVPAVVGAATGALTEYLLDPAAGRARRAKLRDQSVAMARRPVKQVGRATGQKVTYLRGRVQGVAHQMTGPRPVADDKALADKVRSEVLGDPRFSAYRVNLDAVDGVVTMRGQIDDRATIKDLVAAVERVHGVRRVENLLHTPGTAAPNVKGR